MICASTCFPVPPSPLLTAVSGEVAKEPVLSPKSGSIFEKALILNLLSTTGKDPINDEPLAPEELIVIRDSDPAIVAPKPPTHTSLPAMLAAFQNEWDSIALEVFTLRKQLHKARHELSTALYHYDAAVNVAATAIRERDEARAALQELSVAVGNGKIENGHDVEPTAAGVPVDTIMESQAALFQLHKSLKVSLPIAPDAEVSIQQDKEVSTAVKKVTSVFVDKKTQRILLGSSAGPVIEYSYNKDDNNIHKISHKGTVSSIALVEKDTQLVPLVVSKTKVSINNATYKHAHKSEILTAIVHPGLHNLFLLQSKSAWSLNDANSGPLSHIDVDRQLSTAALHVDGVLFAVGGEGEILIYNITTGELASQVKTKHAVVSRLLFALNGYWLLVGSHDGDESSLEVVDLRSQSVVHSISMDGLRDFDIDPSSTLVVTASSSQLAVHRYTKKGKKWTDNAAVLEASVQHILITSDINDDTFQEKGVVSGVTTLENGTLNHFHLQYS